MIPQPISPFKCDVLVYDTIGSSWIRYCIPESTSWRILDIRNHRPIFFNPKFFFQLTKNFFHYSNVDCHRRYLSYISTIFDYVNPRIVITFADNNVVLGQYAAHSPNTLVVSVQNAIRGTVDSIPPRTMLPIYYSLGRAEKQVFNAIGITHQEYVPLGSLKLGLFLQQHYQPGNQWDLSFCSHYRPELIKKSASRLFRLIEDAHRHLFQLTCQYARHRKLSVAVLSKTREPESQKMEEKYFRDLANGCSFSLILADKSDQEFSTYQGAFGSKLVVNLCSTLGYEAFGAGKKVLFGSGYRQDLLDDWGAVQYYEKLPDFICLQNDSSSDFFSRADTLFNMEDSIYKQKTQHAAQYYLAMPKNCYPHDVIRKRLADHLAMP